MATNINAGNATSGAAISADATGILAFQSGSTPTTAVTISATQNVGIGTTASLGKLVVQSTIIAKASDDESILYLAHNGSEAVVAASYGSTGSYDPLTFKTSDAERMRIDSSGNLLVGKTSKNNTSGNGFQCESNGTVNVVTSSSTSSFDTYEIYSTGAGAYRFYVTAGGVINATSTSITAISDQRLKENVRPLDLGLAEVLSLQPRRYDWIEGKGQNKKDAVGFIAQEFETVLPNSVGTSKAGEDGIEYKNINYEELVPTLVKAIQELKEQVDAQALEIQALKGVA